MTADYFGYTYATFVAAGGIFGYVKSNSMMSLLSGLLFGGVLLYGAIESGKGNHYVAFCGSTFLGGLMGYRFLASGKFMPAGLISSISIVNVIRLSITALMPQNENK